MRAAVKRYVGAAQGLTELVANEIRRQVSRLGLASKADVERLRQRVQALEISERSRRRSANASRPAAARRRKPAAKTASKARKRPSSKR